MSWLDFFRRSRRRDQSAAPVVKRTPFVLLERRNLSPSSSALMAQLSRRYTVIPMPDGRRHAFRVGVSDSGPDSDPAQHLAEVLAELDPGWEQHFSRPMPMPRRD